MTVTIEEIQKVIDPRARWLGKDSSGYVYWYVYNPYTCEGRNILGCLGRIQVAEFKGKNWEDCMIALKSVKKQKVKIDKSDVQSIIPSEGY